MPISIPQYLLESSLGLMLFYGFYYLVLRRETFFQLNRFYLLITPLLALTVPLLNIELAGEGLSADTPVREIVFPAVSTANSLETAFWEPIHQPAPLLSFSIGDALFLIYLLGVLVMGYRLTLGLIRLFRLIRRSRRQAAPGYTLVETQAAFPAASFFGYLFWNSDRSQERREILYHELVHIRQRHSLDVLLMELMVVAKWFNPLIYYYRRSLRATHEFIADRYVVQHTGSAYQYAALLVSQGRNDAEPALLNTFNSLLKKRILMLKQRPSRAWKTLKYLGGMPLLASLMLLFSFDLAEELPSQMVDRLVKTETSLRDWSERPVLQLQEEKENYRFQWGDYQCDCFPDQLKDLYHCENITLRPAELRQQVDPPLFIVDGKPYDHRAPDREPKTLDPEDIESISVLKGASAVAKYGEAGRNGVVIITTKNGKKPAISPGSGNLIEADQNLFELKSELKTDSSIWDEAFAEKLIVIDGRLYEGVAGKEKVQSIDPEEISTIDIKSLSVLKDESAVTKYAEAGWKGVVIITTKNGKEPATSPNSGNLIENDQNLFELKSEPKIDSSIWDEAFAEKLIVIDGRLYEGVAGKEKIQSMDPEEISTIDIKPISELKDESSVAKYAEAGRNEVVIITTKNGKEPSISPGSGNLIENDQNLFELKSEPKTDSSIWDEAFAEIMIVIDGRRYDGAAGKEKIQSIDPEDISTIEVWKGEAAVAQYGEAARKGVITLHTKAFAAAKPLREAIDRSFTVFPNAATDGTQVNFTLPTRAKVEVAVFSFDGQLLTVLHKGPLAKGAHLFDLERSRLGAAGTYLVHLTVGETLLVRRVVFK